MTLSQYSNPRHLHAVDFFFMEQIHNAFYALDFRYKNITQICWTLIGLTSCGRVAQANAVTCVHVIPTDFCFAAQSWRVEVILVLR